jgi:glutamate racemase
VNVSTHSIGVFDSGIGGLTVVKELFATVPAERIVYFGDTARVPYGTKSVETVKRYAREDTELLLAHDVRLLVIACNTVSAIAMEEVVQSADGIPVIGMIGPAAKEAAGTSLRGRIGIIGTEATVASEAYERALAKEGERLERTIETFSTACPLFVPLAEEGWTDHAATELIAREYLQPLLEANVDTLILGCTHYPVLEAVIQRVMGPAVALINSGAVAAREVRKWIDEAGQQGPEPEHLMLVSDVPRKFQRIGERFLGRALPEVRQVVFKESWVIRREASLS